MCHATISSCLIKFSPNLIGHSIATWLKLCYRMFVWSWLSLHGEIWADATSRVGICRSTNQCSRLKSPFKRDLALQNIRFSKQPFSMQPQIENEDITWSPQYNMSVTTTKQRKALLLQEVELDGWFVIHTLYWKHVPYNSCTTLTWVLYYISIFLDWRLGFEPTL